MSTNELHLDSITYARAKQLADASQMTVEELVSEAIKRYQGSDSTQPTNGQTVIGLFADAPELLDQIVEGAYRDRERISFRQATE